MRCSLQRAAKPLTFKIEFSLLVKESLLVVVKAELLIAFNELRNSWQLQLRNSRTLGNNKRPIRYDLLD